MEPSIAIGTVLVLATWVALACCVVLVGLLPASLADPQASRAVVVRSALWWGLALGTLVVLLVGLAVPLGDPAAGLAVLAIVAALGVAGLTVLRRHPSGRRRKRLPRSTLALLIAAGLALVYLAFKALGPVTNYDTGLYHLGMIRYAADFTPVPGLAVLFNPFGYNNAQFPVAALLGNGPWDGLGYRLVNGLVIALVVADVGLRLITRRITWGTLTLVVGLAGLALPFIAIADFWVASPTSDTAVALLTIVCLAALADLLGDARDPRTSLAVVGTTVVVMAAHRPTSVVFGLVTLAVVIGVAWRRRGSLAAVLPWALLSGLAVGTLVVQAARDRLLSGWFMYPLSVFSWDVPWLAPDPVNLRTATLYAARDYTTTDGYQTAHSWDWIPIWLSRLGGQWETWFLVIGLLLCALAWVVAHRSAGFPRRPGLLALAVLPSLVSVVVWFTLSPPSFRFIWGPLFGIPFVVLGAAVSALHRQRRRLPRPLSLAAPLVVTAAAVTIAGVTLVSAVGRSQVDQVTEPRAWDLGPISLHYSVAPIREQPTRPVTMLSGLVLQTPTETDQCWGNYPLCSYSMGDRVALLGSDLQEGFFVFPGAAGDGS